VLWSSRAYARQKMGDLRWERGGFAFCSIGSLFQALGWKKRCTLQRGWGSVGIDLVREPASINVGTVEG
jgi:hypothetical protein